MSKICLNMIVRDEGAVVARCLHSIKRFVDSWCIVDTGSKDDTIEKVRKAMEGIPGELHEREWVNMGHNRLEAMELARAMDDAPEHLLFIDADMIGRPNHDFRIPETLDHDAYMIKIAHGGLTWSLPMLVRADKPWKYTGEAHATLMCDEKTTSEILDGLVLEHTEDGHRRATQDHSVKYENDVKLLQKQLRDDPKNTRAIYYLAQSYASLGDQKKAIRWYRNYINAKETRSEMVWASHFYIAVLLQEQDASVDKIEKAHLAAFEVDPRRAEPLVYLAHHLRQKGRPARAFIFASAAIGIPYPAEAMMNVEDVIYQWQALDEFSTAAYMIGRHDEAREGFTELLKVVPESEKPRVQANLDSVESVLAQQATG